jgi:SAM-dependent methyltransferase
MSRRTGFILAAKIWRASKHLRLLTPTIQPEDDWEQHWREYSDSAEINPAQRYRSRLALELLRVGDGEARVVDIGSGQGDFAAELKRRHPRCEVLGLEYSQSGIDVASAKVPTATFLRRDLTIDAEPPPEYRAWGTHAMCIEVLEHVDSPRSLLANAAAYLGSGCRLVVTVPGGPMSAYDKHIGHRRHYTPTELRRLLTEAGFEVEVATTAGFPFHNLYRLVVILRGRKLADDVAAGSSGYTSTLARVVMRVFDVLFRTSLQSSRWGWQMVAVARVPGTTA